MPRKYDLSKPGDLRRWTQSIQKDIQKEFDREAKRNPIRMPLQVEPTRPPQSDAPVERSATSQTLEVDHLPGGGDVYCRQLDIQKLGVGVNRDRHP